MTARLMGEPGVAVLSSEELGARQRSLWLDAFYRLARNRVAMVGLVIVVAFGVLAAFAPLLARYPPNAQHVVDSFAPPFTGKYWFGADQLGRDEYSRMLYGLRISLEVGVLVQVIVVAIGMTVGGLAALGGQQADNLLMRLTDIFYAFPDLLLIILLESVFGAGLLQIFVAIGLVNWVTIARLVRGQMLSLKQQDFVLAARALGASPGRILFRHLLPNTLSPIIVAVTFGIPAAIFTEAALSFIGIGLPPPNTSLGTLIQDGEQAIYAAPNLVVFPALAIALLMLAFTFVGDGLRDALDPRTR
jgi:oligopeptide transport system permease protein